MNLLADEGVDKQIVIRLREDGYSVSSVISKHSQELAKAFTVITPLGVRIRSSEK